MYIKKNYREYRRDERLKQDTQLFEQMDLLHLTELIFSAFRQNRYLLWYLYISYCISMHLVCV